MSLFSDILAGPTGTPTQSPSKLAEPEELIRQIHCAFRSMDEVGSYGLIGAALEQVLAQYPDFESHRSQMRIVAAFCTAADLLDKTMPEALRFVYCQAKLSRPPAGSIQ